MEDGKELLAVFLILHQLTERGFCFGLSYYVASCDSPAAGKPAAEYSRNELVRIKIF